MPGDVRARANIRTWQVRLAACLCLAALPGLQGVSTASAEPATQLGVDVSSWQGSSIGWQSVAGAGISFAYIRAADGSATPDVDFQTNWNGARAVGIAPGAYLYFHPGQDPGAQAALLIQQLQSVNFVRGDLVPAIDVEITEGLPPATIVSNLGAVVNIVRSSIGVLPAIYASPSWWDANVQSSGFTADPLWVACWCGGGPSLPANNWGGYGWRAWQFTDNASVPGIPGGVDEDRGGPLPPAYEGAASLVGTHFASLDTAGKGSYAVAVNDGRTYAMPASHGAFGGVQTWSRTPFYGTRGTTFADLDGPGHPDSAVAINDSSIWVMSNEGGSFGDPQAWSSALFYGTRGTFLADLDGSGRASAVAINDSSIWVMRNQGGSFGPPQLWSGVPFYGTRATLLAVIDGSHRASAVAINNDSIWVKPSQGTSFGSPRAWSGVPFYGTRDTFLADLDGSGRSSAVAINDSSIWVESNNAGSGFGGPTQWAAGYFFGNWEYMADLDGSGRASAIAVNGGSIWVRENTGSAFGPPTLWLTGAFYGTH